jgi:D-arginine utilization repressor
MQSVLTKHIPICKAIGHLFPSIIEVVLHDLVTQKIVHIENSFSNRVSGDDSLIDLEELEIDAAKSDILGPYRKIHTDGSNLKSISSIIRDDHNKSIALLCINLKTEVFSEASRLLSSLVNISTEKVTTSPNSLLIDDWREQVNTILKTILEQRNITLVAAKKADKRAILRAIHQKGIFEIRGSSNYVASVLGISRASLYQILKQAKN